MNLIQRLFVFLLVSMEFFGGLFGVSHNNLLAGLVVGFIFFGFIFGFIVGIEWVVIGNLDEMRENDN